MNKEMRRNLLNEQDNSLFVVEINSKVCSCMGCLEPSMACHHMKITFELQCIFRMPFIGVKIISAMVNNFKISSVV